jgi:hypothetical protein
MDERTPTPKAKTSPLNRQRRLPVVLLGAATVRCRRRAPCLSLLGADLRVEQLFFSHELAHAVATGPSAPQRRPELHLRLRRARRDGAARRRVLLVEP